MSSSDTNENGDANLLLHPYKRSDILGKDEDLDSIEEFYIKEIQEIVNGDDIQKMKKEEGELKMKIHDLQIQIQRDRVNDTRVEDSAHRLTILKH